VFAVAATSLLLVSAPVPASGTVAQGTWQRHVVTGTGPGERSAPVAAAVDSQLYVFGGVRDDFATGQNVFFNDLFRLDTRTDTWTRLAPVGGPPAPRAFAGGAGAPRHARFFVFGGSTFDSTSLTVFDDLWSYTPATNRWTRLGSTTPGPSGRSGPAMWVVGTRLYVFGGIDATFTTLNDLWLYDLVGGAWTEVRPTGARPQTRHVAQAGDVARFGRLTLYGGEGDPSLGFPLLADTWELDLVHEVWREVTPVAADIPPRNYGAAAVLGAQLYLQGGDRPGGSAGCGAPFPQNPVDELWRFDLVERTWHRVTPGGDPLARLKRHAAATVDGRMYIVSGWDFRCDGGVGPGQVWNTDVFSFRR
jgi:N-acetylneuraminic acid mutarotase